MRTFLMLLCSLISIASFASEGVTSIGGRLTRAEFQKRVDSCITILRRSDPLTVEEAVLLVRVANTLYLLDGEKTKKEVEFGGLMRFSVADRLENALGESIPNHGMGLYYKKHDLHYGGAPGNIRDRDSFTINDKS